MLSYAGQPRQSNFKAAAYRSLPLRGATWASGNSIRRQAGLLCYTSVVINWGCAGTWLDDLSACRACNRRSMVHAAALAAGKLRALIAPSVEVRDFEE
jgi:hypothetical protein